MFIGRANFASLWRTNKRSGGAGVKRCQRNPDTPADVTIEVLREAFASDMLPRCS
jgi:hypothetical protein